MHSLDCTHAQTQRAWRALHCNTKHHLDTACKGGEGMKKSKGRQSEMLAVTISVSRYAGPTSASMAALVVVNGTAETQGSDIRVEKACEPKDHQETTSRTTTAQQVRDEAQETTTGGGRCVGSQWLPGMTVSQPDWLASPI